MKGRQFIMKKNMYMMIGLVGIMVLVLVGIYMYSYKISILFSMIAVLILLGIVIGSLLLLRKKDEMQSQIIKNAMASAFSMVMAMMVVISLLELASYFKLVGTLNNNNTGATGVLVVGLTSFLFNLYTENKKVQVGNRDEE